jgi:hypothetical protein
MAGFTTVRDASSARECDVAGAYITISGARDGDTAYPFTSSHPHSGRADFLSYSQPGTIANAPSHRDHPR